MKRLLLWIVILLPLAVGFGALGGAFWLSEEFARSHRRAPTLQWVTPRGTNGHGRCPRVFPRTLAALAREFRSAPVGHFATYIRSVTRCLPDDAIAALAQDAQEAARQGDRFALLLHDALARDGCRQLVARIGGTQTSTLAQEACAEATSALIASDAPMVTGERRFRILRVAELAALLVAGEHREDLVAEFCTVYGDVIVPNTAAATVITRLAEEYCGS